MRTTQRKGDIAVSQAVATFTRLGYDVALPLTESAPYDLLIDTGDKVYKIQVRYSSESSVELRRIHSNSKGYVIKKTKFQAYDWLYVFRPNGEEFLIKQCLDARRSIKPRDEHKLIVQPLTVTDVTISI